MSAPRGPLPGFRDFYPAEMAERLYVMERWREVARRYGFVEYDGPPLEPLELYTKKSGDEIVAQLYAFRDKGGREVALRPEMTPTLARMVGARANAMRKPIRWFSMPQLFRYERQQRGRLREHFQLNVDIIGEADVTADAELLAVAIDVMRSFGLTSDDVQARVSDRRLLEALLRIAGVDAAQLPAVYAVVDKIERESRASLERKLADAGFAEVGIASVFEVLSATDLASLRAKYGDRPELRDDFARLARYLECLDALGVADWVRFDLSIVRGLAYYTGIVFELFDVKGELRAICGGGRYDTLLGALGGADLPALGFGMGDVVLSDLLRSRNLLPKRAEVVDFWLVTETPELLGQAMRIAQRLRKMGYSVEHSLREQSFDRQRKSAKASAATRIIEIPFDFDTSPRIRWYFADPVLAQQQGEAARTRLHDFETVMLVFEVKSIHRRDDPSPGAA